MSRKRSKITPKVDFLTKSDEIVPKSDPKWDPKSIRIVKISTPVSEPAQRRPGTALGPPKWSKRYQKLSQMVPQNDENQRFREIVFKYICTSLLQKIFETATLNPFKPQAMKSYWGRPVSRRRRSHPAVPCRPC